MTQAVILVGRGRYDDPWHDDAAVADQIRSVLADLGVEAQLRGTYRTALDDVEPGALIVVCAGRGRIDPDFDGDDASWVPFHDRLASLVAEGSPLLGLHAAANTFGDASGWASLLGGRWVVGTSMHPPRGPAQFAVAGGHPAAPDLKTLTTDDERYCRLEVSDTSTVLVTTEFEGKTHPVAWVAQHGRVIYDGLGHDVRATRQPDRLTLLRAEVAWLLHS
ncbi:ThuA domain-containing protein [Kineosporia babensis]|uniref:ThuA domain-containing protein n=1 Tax=Kineosporia babensis TaxID=499548 RepID=A0A9X1NF78_9ACTN|nr:ThuA domain-containing protein [Kineosporia babensis]MCD5311988.1 ThuA domain-containing protein [Kineosporia babensis]